MAARDCSWSDLCGRTITFIDLRTKELFAQLSPPSNYPPEYLSCEVTGFVELLSVEMPFTGPMRLFFEVSGTQYDFSQVEILSIQNRYYRFTKYHSSVKFIPLNGAHGVAPAHRNGLDRPKSREAISLKRGKTNRVRLTLIDRSWRADRAPTTRRRGEGRRDKRH